MAGRTRKTATADKDNGPQMTEELSTTATRITSKGVSTDKPAPIGTASGEPTND